MSEQSNDLSPDKRREAELQDRQFFWWVRRLLSPQSLVIFVAMAWMYWAVTVWYAVEPGTPLFFALWLSGGFFLILAERLIWKAWPMEPMPRASPSATSLVSLMPDVEHVCATSDPEHANHLISEGWVLTSVTVDATKEGSPLKLHFSPKQET